MCVDSIYHKGGSLILELLRLLAGERWQSKTGLKSIAKAIRCQLEAVANSFCVPVPLGTTENSRGIYPPDFVFLFDLVPSGRLIF